MRGFIFTMFKEVLKKKKKKEKRNQRRRSFHRKKKFHWYLIAKVEASAGSGARDYASYYSWRSRNNISRRTRRRSRIARGLDLE